jgi:hypothetical protein
METRNVKQKEVGFAIHGLRAYIKALELSQGVQVSKNDYRYEIAEDRTSARIIVAADRSEVESTNRALAGWAKIGKEARVGLIGLKSEKHAYRARGEHVQFTLDILADAAYLSKDGKRLEDQPQTIADWAKRGHEVERKLFEDLKIATEHGLEDLAKETRDAMVRLGVIREPRPVSTGNQTAADTSAQT